jgi:hypothetical protein
MQEYRDTAAAVWDEYQRGLEYLTANNWFARCDECCRFFDGDQWYGLKTGGDRPPMYNIIRPIVEYKQAMVAQNGMSMHYSTMNYGDGYQENMRVCDKLNNHAMKNWERLKLDQVCWDLISDACVVGDSFAYFYFEDNLLNFDAVDTTNILFADEQEADVQNQRYILIAQRLFVEDVKEKARENGLSEDDIASIRADTDTTHQLGDRAKNEVGYDDADGDDGGKCISILRLWKEDGIVHISRSTKELTYQPDMAIDGMHLYPIAHYIWKREKGSARGVGEVYDKIPNQIEINKGLARLLAGIKQYAFPHIVYDNAILTKENVEKLSLVGSNIGVNANKMQRVSDTIQYMQPAQINPLAREIVYQMVSQTRELAGAGEAVTGQVNPEQASGAAIIAVRDAAALPLNGQVASFRQFVEDIARIWFDIWVAYHPAGMTVVTESEGDNPKEEVISAEALQNLKVDVRVDVSPDNPYSKFAQEQSLQNLYAQQAVTFEEYVAMLDENAVAPKAKLQELVDKRKAQAEKKAKQMLPGILKQMEEGKNVQGQAAQSQAVPSQGQTQGQALENGEQAVSQASN